MSRGTALPFRPSGLAQTLDYVGVVFRPYPRKALADIGLDMRRCNRDSLLQRLLRLRSPTELAERRGEYTVGARTIGV